MRHALASFPTPREPTRDPSSLHPLARATARLELCGVGSQATDSRRGKQTSRQGLSQAQGPLAQVPMLLPSGGREGHRPRGPLRCLMLFRGLTPNLLTGCPVRPV